MTLNQVSRFHTGDKIQIVGLSPDAGVTGEILKGDINGYSYMVRLVNGTIKEFFDSSLSLR